MFSGARPQLGSFRNSLVAAAIFVAGVFFRSFIAGEGLIPKLGSFRIS
jgi:hypothetical protein